VELVHRDPVSLWLESEQWGRLHWTRADQAEPYIVARYDPSQGELFEELSARFGSWCRTTNQSSVGVKTFALRLRQEGFTSSQKRAAGDSRPRMYFVPPRLLTVSPNPNHPPADHNAPTPKPPHDPLLPGY
jgi:hypothetical protein